MTSTIVQILTQRVFTSTIVQILTQRELGAASDMLDDWEEEEDGDADCC
jgi:hypothetical protein